MIYQYEDTYYITITTALPFISLQRYAMLYIYEVGYRKPNNYLNYI